jgi:hypothetical protein
MQKACLTVLLLGLLVPAAVVAQQTVNVENQYVAITYFHVPADKDAEYNQVLRASSKKYYEELINQPGSNLWAWGVARMLYTGTHGGEANYVSSSLYDGPPANPNTAANDALLRKVTGQDPEEYRRHLNTLRTVVGTELLRGIAWARGPVPEDSYRVVSYLKITTNKGAAFRDLIKQAWQPIYADALKEGKILGWGAWGYVFPRGADTPYDALTSMTFKDLPSAVKGLEGMDAAFAKAHPGVSMVGAIDALRDTRKVTRTVLSRILVSAQKAQR